MATREEVRDEFKQLGSEYDGLADQLYDLGVDGDFITHQVITDEELENKFGLKNPLARRVVQNKLGKFRPQPVSIASVGYLCVHMTFDKNPNSWQPPSSEYVRNKVTKLMGYESARHILMKSATGKQELNGEL